MGWISAIAGLLRSKTTRKGPATAGVYLVNQRLLVFTHTVTDQGASLQANPIALRLSVNKSELIAALGTSFGASGKIVAHPARHEWAGSFEPFLRAAGVRSQRAFMQTAELVGLEESADGILVTPFRNLGSKEGFEEDLDARFTVTAGVEDLAARIVRHFGLDMIS